MKKYAMIMVAIAAVVLLSIDDASARNPRNSGTGNKTNATWQNTPMGSGSQTTTQPTQTQIQKQATGLYGSNQGVTTQPMQQSRQTQQAQQMQQVRANAQKQFGNVFTSQWYAKHPDAWQHVKSGANMWTTVNSWSTLANWVSVNATAPSDYVLVYEEDTYYLNDEAVTAEQYIVDIIDLATENQSNMGTTNPNDWMPLGVFVVTPSGSTQTPNRVFQFAIHKNGQLAGTCYDASSGKPIRITGSLDKETQRVAWTLGENNETVMETSLGNFVENQSTVTLHQGGSTETMTMVRLEGPVKQAQTGTTNQGSTGSNQQK
ncbi:MAG TPA: hypothetical protein DD670_21535 [Planctomycetaceae bacterium]|nr:hypothetical protein [Planctomycetaceae bacterium]